MIEIRKPNDKEKTEAETWPIWEKETSSFEWEYDNKETCLILEGKAKVRPEEGNEVNFGPGDYVIFPKGLKCVWTIKEPIKKHYKFG